MHHNMRNSINYTNVDTKQYFNGTRSYDHQNTRTGEMTGLSQADYLGLNKKDID